MKKETAQANARKGSENRSEIEKFRLTPKTKKLLERTAALKGLSKSDIVHTALQIHLVKNWTADSGIPAELIEDMI